MFHKTIDKTNREEMTNFLKNHFRYYTMNSWNRSTSYANNVKLHNLALTDEQFHKAFDILSEDEDLDTSYYHDQIHQLIQDFKLETGYDMGFNGRSNGYLVLYDTQYNPFTKQTNTYPGRSIDANEDFDEDDWTLDMLAKRVDLVCTFDLYCDKIRDVLIDTLENCEINTYKKEIIITKQILEPKK